jgi:hypothetical protein
MPEENLSLLATEAIDAIPHVPTLLATNLVTSPASQEFTRIWHNVLGGERETIEHMWNGCSEMRERGIKERGEILNEDGREIR